MNDVQKKVAEELEFSKKKDIRHMSFSEMVDEPDSLKLARIVFFQRDQKKYMERISNNLVWFFWISLIYLLVSIIVILSTIT